MKIEQYNPEFIRIDPAPRHSTLLNENDLKQLLAWLKVNKPGIWWKIFCEDCPEVC